MGKVRRRGGEGVLFNRTRRLQMSYLQMNDNDYLHISVACGKSNSYQHNINYLQHGNNSSTFST